MSISWNKTWSAAMYRATKRSAVLRPLAMFCANVLLFVMITAVAMTYGGPDAMMPISARFLAASIVMGVPLVASWLVSYVLQQLVRRPRPFESDQGEPLITMTWIGHSFPSAHAAIAFATAIFGQVIFPDIYGPWLLVGAIFVALGRVAVGVHYLSDVIVGALVGSVTGGLTLMGFLWLLFTFFPH